MGEAMRLPTGTGHWWSHPCFLTSSVIRSWTRAAKAARSSGVSGWLVCIAKRREASSLVTLASPVEAQMEAALADHAVAKLVRGPT